MSVLSEIAETAATVTDRAGSAVVAIGRDRRGAGVVVAPGRVLTNAHNLRDRTTTVTFVDGRTSDAALVGVDLDGDVAVLEVDTTGYGPVRWLDEFLQLRPGTPVFGLANPGGRGLRATFGTISAVDQTFRGPRGRRITGAIEHTAPLGRGSSGGPLVDLEGNLLALNTNRAGDGFYLALPADADLRQRVEALGRGETPKRRRLGVGLAPSQVANRLRQAVGLPPRDGLLVQTVEDGGPADRAGLRSGDLIVSASDRQVARVDDLLEAIEAVDGDAALRLGIVRGVEEMTMAVSFQEQATRSEGAV